MDDFNNINDKENVTGSLNGFDSADNGSNDGGFYNMPKQNIIQDEPLDTAKPQAEPEPNMADETKEQPFSTENTSEKAEYYPNGQYANYGAYYTPKRVKVKKEKRRYGAGVVITASFLAAVIGALSGIAAVVFTTEKPKVTDKVYQPESNVNINIEETAESVVEAVATKVIPSVVGIRTTTSVMNFFGGTSEASGEGSGVIYREDGYIITNYHVIGEAISNKSGSKIEVFLESSTSESIEATVVGYNISSDLAVIKINATGLKAVTFSDSENLKVGQYVITVGNPGGLEFMDSVTYGVISGLNRVVSSDSGLELIQTDAAINPGNSGGALVNTKGELVGINSSKIVSEEFEGMGFAIPSNTVKSICDNIIDKENSPEPYIGISISETYTPQRLEYYGYPVGAVVLSVADGSPADEAGLERGDIITEFDGKKITDYTVLEDLMMQSTPGDTVEIKLYRSGRYYKTKISIGYNNAVD